MDATKNSEQPKPRTWTIEGTEPEGQLIIALMTSGIKAMADIRQINNMSAFACRIAERIDASMTTTKEQE